MKKVLWMVAAGALLALAACSMKVASASRRGAGGNPLIFRVHSVGAEQLFAAPEAAKLAELRGLKSSAALREEVLTRFALLPSFWLGDSLPKGAASQTNLFRPLLDDLLTHECYLDCVATPDLLVAVRVPEARARVWQTNLWQALNNWKLGTPAAAKFDTFAGFEVKRAALPGVIRCVRAGEWIVLSAGSGKFARETEVLANIKSTGRPAKPTGAWLDGDANLARFDGWLPLLASLDNLPVAHFSVSNRADFVRTYATLDFPKPHGWKTEPWHIPTNVLHEPLIDFTAVRGIAPFIESFKPVADLGYKPMPNELFGWAYGGVPFQFNYAAPSRDVTNQLKKIQPQLEKLVLGQSRTNLSGPIVWETNSHNIVWHGLLGAVPTLGALHSGSQEFMVLSCFPPSRGTNPPPELYRAFVGRDELVAFDFELTSFRVPHWRQYYQIAEVASFHPLGAVNSPFQNWLTDAMPKLGEAVTEVRATSPTQMTFVRKSTMGLTGVELVTLGRWLESAKFPEFGVFAPTPPRRLPGRRTTPPPKK